MIEYFKQRILLDWNFMMNYWPIYLGLALICGEILILKCKK